MAKDLYLVIQMPTEPVVVEKVFHYKNYEQVYRRWFKKGIRN